MYGLSTDFPFGDLGGAELQQICFGENEVIFNFSDNISVLVMSEIRIGSEENAGCEDFKSLSGELLRLLGLKITRAASQNNKDITLLFSDGTDLTLIDNSESFESYVISMKSKKYVI